MSEEMQSKTDQYDQWAQEALYDSEPTRRLNAIRTKQEIDEQSKHGYLYDVLAGVGDGVTGFTSSATKLVSNLTGLKEDRAFDLNPEAQTFVGNTAAGLTQFLLAFNPASRGATALGRGLGLTGKYGARLMGASAGFASDFTAFDGEHRMLGDFLAEHPKLAPPILSYLASDPHDNWAVKRFKNGLEGLGLGVLTDTIFHGIKAWKARGTPEAAAASAEVEKSLETLSKERPAFFDWSDDPAAVPTANRSAQATAQDAAAMKAAGLAPSDLQAASGKVSDVFPGKGVPMPDVPPVTEISNPFKPASIGATYTGDAAFKPAEYDRPGVKSFSDFFHQDSPMPANGNKGVEASPIPSQSGEVNRTVDPNALPKRVVPESEAPATTPQPGVADVFPGKGVPNPPFRSYADAVFQYDDFFNREQAAYTARKASIVPQLSAPEFPPVKPGAEMFTSNGAGKTTKVTVQSVEPDYVVVKNAENQYWHVAPTDLAHTAGEVVHTPKAEPINVPRDSSVPMC